MPDMRPGFHLNKATIGWAARNDPGLIAALDDLAEPTARDAGGHVEAYTTDRAVRAVVVDAEDQAKNGAGTKAAAKNGMQLR